MKHPIYILLALFIITGCKENSNKGVNKSQRGVSISSPISNEAILEKDGYTFELEYSPLKDITSMISHYKGETRKTYELEGKMNKSFYSDINNDEKKELFISMQSKSGKVTLNGYSLNAGYPIPIYISEITGIGKTNFKSYTKSENQIIESFQVMAPDKSIIKKVLRYNLIEGKTGYSLKPEGFTSDQLKKIEGVYSSNDGGNSEKYKTLIISQNEYGEWTVEIEVRKKSTTKSICRFKSAGDFYSKELYVPLGLDNPDLSGTLKISFVENMVSIYTLDPNDAKQMAVYCNNLASIAGNFKKELNE